MGFRVWDLWFRVGTLGMYDTAFSVEFWDVLHLDVQGVYTQLVGVLIQQVEAP